MSAGTSLVLIGKLTLAWLFCLLLWLLFVFQLSLTEIVAGAISSAVAVLFGWVTFRIAPARFQPPLHSLAQVWRVPALVLSDFRRLLLHLMRTLTSQPSHSNFAELPFHASGKDAEASAKRALAVLLVSTTPNAIVLDIDEEKQSMLVHQMESAPTPELVTKLQE